jgi:hypothetical protein
VVKYSSTSTKILFYVKKYYLNILSTWIEYSKMDSVLFMHSCSLAHACKLVDSIPLQTNRYVGWLPPIPMNYEGQIIESMVNHGVGVLMASPY